MDGVKAPAKLNFDASICDSGATQWIGVFGEFGTRRLSSKKPVVKLMMDKENIPLKWTFHMGGVNGDSETHSFTIGMDICFFCKIRFLYQESIRLFQFQNYPCFVFKQNDYDYISVDRLDYFRNIYCLSSFGKYFNLPKKTHLRSTPNKFLLQKEIKTLIA